MADDQADVLIIGAGAAGLMCAIVAARRGRRVLVLDHARRIGEKIRISGGGRCNFTNLNASPENYVSDNPRFCISALSSFSPQDFLAMVDAHGIPWHEKEQGQLFCDRSASDILDMLFAECAEAGVHIRSAVSISEVKGDDAGFVVVSDAGTFQVPALVIASGGKSIPKIGATGFGYQVAQHFDINVIQTRAGLVPFVFDDRLRASLEGLSGISLNASLRTGKKTLRDALLFTHRGLSGPAVLKLSSHWREGMAVVIDMVPETDVFDFLKKARKTHPKQALATRLGTLLPKRLAQWVAADGGADGQRRMADLSDRVFKEIAGRVNRWTVTPSGTEGYRTAEVTLGGVDTRALSSKTLACRDVPGLYFIGEVVDVTGDLGGYNFQWAWASGAAAGRHV